MSRVIAAIPDLQVPDEDVPTVRKVIDFLGWLEPDELLCVGDELDSPEPSRWNKGYAGEYAGTLQKSIDRCHALLTDFRETTPGPFHLMRSNHQERIQKYVSRFAPALSSLRSLDYPTLLGLGDIGITFHRQPYEFAPGWMLAHGDEGSLIQTPGGTGMGLAKKWGKSVVCGHTHKAGIQHQHLSVNSKITTHLFGMEIGHLMAPKKADYLSAGYANWQQAFAVFHVEGRNVYPTLIPIVNGRFTYEGKTW